MSHVHQIYCTHCTHGSSALERRDGDLANRTLGYSARAASLEHDELRRYYRQVEKFMYYHLPQDTPADKKLQLTAADSPKRLVFCPNINELQMLAQVCYRQKDTAGRPGSYFGHVLVGPKEANARPWKTLECLAMWGAPQWVEQEPAGEIGPLLSYGSMSAWLQEATPGNGRAAGRCGMPVIGDTVLHEFLTADKVGSYTASDETIPPRMREVDQSERGQLLKDCLHRFLELDDTRESLLLVAEPGLAALLFYGIVRLIPEKCLRSQVSFSTYEAHPNRLCTTLAATTFHNVEVSDLPPDLYRSPRGACLSTWLSRRRTRTRQASSRFAELAVETVINDGWDALEALHSDFHDAGVEDFRQLEAVAATHDLVSEFLDPASEVPRGAWMASPVARSYLRMRVKRELAKPDKLAAVQSPGSKAHLQALELLAVDGAMPNAEPVLQSLLDTLPERQLPKFLGCETAPESCKLYVLARHVNKYFALPPGGHAAALLPKLLNELPDETIEQFWNHLSEKQLAAFASQLAEASRQNRKKQRVLSALLESMDEAALCVVLTGESAKTFLRNVEGNTAFGKRLRAMTRRLLQDPGLLQTRRAALNASRDHLAPSDRAKLKECQELLDSMQAIAAAVKASGAKRWRKRREFNGQVEQAGTRFVAAMNRLFPQTEIAAPPGDKENDRLKRLKPILESAADSSVEFSIVWEEIRRVVLPTAIASIDDDTLCAFLLSEKGKAFLQEYPRGETVLANRLLKILDALHCRPEHFTRRLNALNRTDTFLAEGRDRLHGWQMVCKTLEQGIGPLGVKSSELMIGRCPPRLVKATIRQAHELAKAFSIALPPKLSDLDVAQRYTALLQISEVVLDGRLLYGIEAALNRPCLKALERPKSIVTKTLFVLALLAAPVPGLLFLWYHTGGNWNWNTHAGSVDKSEVNGNVGEFLTGTADSQLLGASENPPTVSHDEQTTIDRGDGTESLKGNLLVTVLDANTDINVSADGKTDELLIGPSTQRDKEFIDVAVAPKPVAADILIESHTLREGSRSERSAGGSRPDLQIARVDTYVDLGPLPGSYRVSKEIYRFNVAGAYNFALHGFESYFHSESDYEVKGSPSRLQPNALEINIRQQERRPVWYATFEMDSEGRAVRMVWTKKNDPKEQQMQNWVRTCVLEVRPSEGGDDPHFIALQKVIVPSSTNFVDGVLRIRVDAESFGTPDSVDRLHLANGRILMANGVSLPVESGILAAKQCRIFNIPPLGDVFPDELLLEIRSEQIGDSVWELQLAIEQSVRQKLVKMAKERDEAGKASTVKALLKADVSAEIYRVVDQRFAVRVIQLGSRTIEGQEKSTRRTNEDAVESAPSTKARS